MNVGPDFLLGQKLKATICLIKKFETCFIQIVISNRVLLWDSGWVAVF